MKKMAIAIVLILTLTVPVAASVCTNPMLDEIQMYVYENWQMTEHFVYCSRISRETLLSLHELDEAYNGYDVFKLGDNLLMGVVYHSIELYGGGTVQFANTIIYAYF